MKLPSGERAEVRTDKIRDYLLNESHDVGGPKARFFRSLGFDPAAYELLAEGLKRIAIDGDVVKVVEAPFGKKYIVVGILHGPSGSSHLVQTHWIVREEGAAPDLITAYPVRQSRNLAVVDKHC